MIRLLLVILSLTASVAFGKVYDCFVFINEHEVLDIRLHELYDYVDQFVIVESCETYGGCAKPFRFEENKARYAPFLDKIIYIKLEEKYNADTPKDREIWQLNQIMQALTDCQPDDIILISSCSEIVPGHKIQEVVVRIEEHPFIGFVQTPYAFRLNRYQTAYNKLDYHGSGATTYNHLQSISPHIFRNMIRLGERYAIAWQRAGWYFATMASQHRPIETYLPCSKKPSYHEWHTFVDKFELVPIDETFPQYVQDNIDHFMDIGLIDPY